MIKASWKLWAVGTMGNPEAQHHEMPHGLSLVGSSELSTKVLT